MGGNSWLNIGILFFFCLTNLLFLGKLFINWFMILIIFKIFLTKIILLCVEVWNG